MTSFAFAKGLYSFDWDEDPKLNDRKYRTPVPCRKGYNCVHTECCMFVHPGEEGVGRRLFPARTMDEEPVVRIYGTPEKKAYFYERRRLGLSWPAWCKEMGWTMPANPVHESNNLIQKAANHNRKKILEIDTIFRVEDEENNTLTQNLIQQKIGDYLFLAINNLLDEVAIEEMKKANIYSPSLTPGKIVGMLLESCPVNYCNSLLHNENELHQAVLDACVAIASH